MLGFKKKSEDEVLAAALLKGVTKGRTEKTKDEAKNKAQQTRNEIDLQKAYNKASGVISGLSSLHDLSEQFTFEVAEKQGRFYGYADVYLSIKTNIPAAGSSKGTVTVDVEPNGYMQVNGDSHFSCIGPRGDAIYSDQQIPATKFRATKKVLAYIGKEATKKGLIP